MLELRHLTRTPGDGGPRSGWVRTWPACAGPRPAHLRRANQHLRGRRRRPSRVSPPLAAQPAAVARGEPALARGNCSCAITATNWLRWAPGAGHDRRRSGAGRGDARHPGGADSRAAPCAGGGVHRLRRDAPAGPAPQPGSTWRVGGGARRDVPVHRELLPLGVPGPAVPRRLRRAVRHAGNQGADRALARGEHHGRRGLDQGLDDRRCSPWRWCRLPRHSQRPGRRGSGPNGTAALTGAGNPRVLDRGLAGHRRTVRGGRRADHHRVDRWFARSRRNGRHRLLDPRGVGVGVGLVGVGVGAVAGQLSSTARGANSLVPASSSGSTCCA